MRHNNITNIIDYSFSSADRLFFDTNIWFYALGTLHNPDTYARIYADILKKIFVTKCQIFIDVLVFSEFINRFARDIAEQELGISRDKYKDFRNSKKFKVVAQEVVNAANEIIKLSTRIPTTFDRIDPIPILQEFANKNLDFNDQIIETICLTHNLTLVTHDTDFKHAQCRILTANRLLL